MFISFTDAIGAESLSIIVATPVPSLIVALADGDDSTTRNVSFPSYIVSCIVFAFIVVLVFQAVIVAVPRPCV